MTSACFHPHPCRRHAPTTCAHTPGTQKLLINMQRHHGVAICLHCVDALNLPRVTVGCPSAVHRRRGGALGRRGADRAAGAGGERGAAAAGGALHGHRGGGDGRLHPGGAAGQHRAPQRHLHPAGRAQGVDTLHRTCGSVGWTWLPLAGCTRAAALLPHVLGVAMLCLLCCQRHAWCCAWSTTSLAASTMLSLGSAARGRIPTELLASALQELTAVLLPRLVANLAFVNPPLNVTMAAHWGAGAPDPSPVVRASLVGFGAKCGTWLVVHPLDCASYMLRHACRAMLLDAPVELVSICLTPSAGWIQQLHAEPRQQHRCCMLCHWRHH
jgi:hypothetical protein